MKHSGTRDLPSSTTRTRPLGDAGGVHAHRRRSAAEFAARDPATGEWNGIETGRARMQAPTLTEINGSRRGNGDPKRPAFCMLFEDLAPPDAAPTGVFGMYPAALIPKLLPWLKCTRHELVHVCSGGLPMGEGIRVDIRPEAQPDIIADGRALPFADGCVAGMLIDPPYTEHYARELYNVDYPRPAHLLREAVRVVRPGGRIGFVHYLVPNPPDGAHYVRAFGLSMGFGYPMRAVTLYERNQDSLL